MSNSLQVLADNRDALLLAEVAAWLHMFGKFHEGFLEGIHGVDIEIPDDIKNHYGSLYDILSKPDWTGSVWGKLPYQNELRAKGLSISDLIVRHRRPNPKHEGFVKLMQDAHGRGSGIEKGILLRLSPAHDNERPTYASTSFGYEVRINSASVQKDRNVLYDFLQTQLVDLRDHLSKLMKKTQLETQYWLDFREQFLTTLRIYYLSSVAETRRPANDVTLFDQTAASVAFFKAALAQNLLTEWKEPLAEAVEDKYHWRLLRIGMDGMEFWQNSMRIGDLLSRKNLVKQALDKIQILLEVTYPLGLEVYRDEYGSIFVVPDLDRLQSNTDGAQSIEQHIQSIAQQKFLGEATFTLSLSESTRDTLSFGKLVVSMLPQLVPQFVWLKQQWPYRQEDICPVCGQRSQGPNQKSLARKVCDVCERRRINRSEEWIKNPSTTIWIDEVADRNGQLVLLVGQLGIASWLSGATFNSIVAFDPKSRKLDGDIKFDMLTLVQDIQKKMISGQKSQNDLLHHLISGDRTESVSVPDFYDLLVADTDLGIVSSISQSERLALALIRQYPAFARITRVWRTTKDFWDKVAKAFDTIVYEVSPRLRIRGLLNQGIAVKSHTYELKMSDTSLSVVCINDDEFLTVDNLQRTAMLLNAPDELCNSYDSAASYVQRYFLQNQNRAFEIEGSIDNDGPTRILGRLSIGSVDFDQTPYVPAITILSEPRTFMALVPADKALQVARAIKEKYEEEIGKVRNRLPLTLGVVFAGARTPLPAILDAGRRTLKQPTEATHWQVKGVDLRLYPEKVLLTLVPGQGEEPSLTLDIPAIMGDEETEDVWYPYWCLEEEAANAGERKRKFKGIDGRYWTHVSDLQVGDVVFYMPSRFDFEYLDTAARRFEISYENGKRRGSEQPGSSYHPARPYYLEQLDEFDQLWKILSQGLETTQIYTLIGIIEDKRKEWSADQNNETFKQTVHDALNNANWKPHLKPEQFDQLYRAALSGQLTDVVELYIQILNQRPEADKDQTEIIKAGVNS